MKATLISAVIMTAVLAACGQEPTPPAQPVPPPAPKAAPVTPPPAPSGEMTQEEKEKIAKDAIDAAKSSARKGE